MQQNSPAPRRRQCRQRRLGDCHAFRTLPKVALRSATVAERQGDRWFLSTELENPSKTPALLVRLKAGREQGGNRILPALHDDNFIALMPGEKRLLRTELEQADTWGERPRIVVEGFSLENASGR